MARRAEGSAASFRRTRSKRISSALPPPATGAAAESAPGRPTGIRAQDRRRRFSRASESSVGQGRGARTAERPESGRAPQDRIARAVQCRAPQRHPSAARSAGRPPAGVAPELAQGRLRPGLPRSAPPGRSGGARRRRSVQARTIPAPHAGPAPASGTGSPARERRSPAPSAIHRPFRSEAVPGPRDDARLSRSANRAPPGSQKTAAAPPPDSFVHGLCRQGPGRSGCGQKTLATGLNRAPKMAGPRRGGRNMMHLPRFNGGDRHARQGRDGRSAVPPCRSAGARSCEASAAHGPAGREASQGGATGPSPMANARARLDAESEGLHADSGCPSIAPERLICHR